MARRMDHNRASKRAAGLRSIAQSNIDERDARVRERAERQQTESRPHVQASLRPAGVPEKIYYRSVGSVVLSPEGRWRAMNGTGEVVGEFPERWLAWQLADKFGMERAGSLP